MDKLKELKEKRVGLAHKMRELHDKATEEKRGFSAEERTSWDAMSNDIAGLDATIRAAEQLEGIEERSANIVEIVADANRVSKEEARAKSNDAWRKLILKTGLGIGDFTPEDARWLDPERRTNAQSTTDAKGGFTIPEGFSNELAIARKLWGGVENVSRVIRTATGNDIPWPATNDTSNVAFQVNEAANLETSATDATFAKAVTLKAYKWSSGLVRISSEILQDSYFNMESLLAELFGIRMGRGLNAAFTTGAGTTTISGVVTGATNSAISSVGATAITYNNLVDLMHSIDPAYRMNARYMFNDSTLAYIRKIVDQDDRPLWQPNVVMGAPDMILGKPYTINPDMASIGASAKSVLFGDFQNYIIRYVGNERLVVLRERFADSDQIGLVLLTRVDGQVLDAGMHPIKYMVHAAS